MDDICKAQKGECHYHTKEIWKTDCCHGNITVGFPSCLSQVALRAPVALQNDSTKQRRTSGLTVKSRIARMKVKLQLRLDFETEGPENQNCRSD